MAIVMLLKFLIIIWQALLRLQGLFISVGVLEGRAKITLITLYYAHYGKHAGPGFRNMLKN